MQFYRYLIIKNVKLLIMREYAEFRDGLFFQNKKIIQKNLYKLFWFYLLLLFLFMSIDDYLSILLVSLSFLWIIISLNKWLLVTFQSDKKSTIKNKIIINTFQSSTNSTMNK